MTFSIKDTQRNKSAFMMSVEIFLIVMLSVIVLSVIMLSVVVLSVIMQSVVMLSVVAPFPKLRHRLKQLQGTGCNSCRF